MRCSSRSSLALLAVLATAPAVALAGETDRLASGNHELTLEHGGRSRWAVVHVPPQAEKGGAALPVLLVFHGGGGEPLGMQKMAVGLDGLADREGFITVYPAGTGAFERRLLTWNAGACCGAAARDNVDDVAFVVALLEHLATRAPVDATRVYATGLSNGGMMSYRMAVDASERIAAIAPVAGSMVVVLPGTPKKAVPVLHIHSVDDPRALYTGGLGPPFPLTNVRVLHPPVEKSLAFWVEKNGCKPEAETGELITGTVGSKSEGHTARRIAWSGGRDGSEVVHWKLTGAGHVWPGGEGYLGERVRGQTTQIIDGNTEIWSFVKRFTRADAPALVAKPSDAGK